MGIKHILKKTENYHHNQHYKIKYPGLDAYHFPTKKSNDSPCMDPVWRSQPIRQGKKREE